MYSDSLATANVVKFQVATYWDWLWPYNIFAIFIVAAMLLVAWKAYRLGKKGTTIFDNEKSLSRTVGDIILKSVGLTVAWVAFSMAILFAVDSFNNEDVTQYREGWYQQLQRPTEIFSSIYLGSDPDSIDLADMLPAVEVDSGVTIFRKFENFPVTVMNAPVGLPVITDPKMVEFVITGLSEDVQYLSSEDLSVRVNWSSNNKDVSCYIDVPKGISVKNILPTSVKLVVDTASRKFEKFPVRVVNVPSRASAKADPETVELVVRGPSGWMQHLSYKDLSVQVDYNDLNADGSGFCSLEAPDGISMVQISPISVDVVVDTSFVDEILIGYEINSSSRNWDLVFILILMILFFFAFSKRKVSGDDTAKKSNKALGLTIMVMYILAYVAIRNWLNGNQEFNIFIAIDIGQLLVVFYIARVAYKKLREMLDAGQCIVTLDPITKQPMEYKDKLFFKSGITTFVLFVGVLMVLIYCPLSIITLGASFGTRIFLLFFSLILTAIAWSLLRIKIVKDAVEKINNRSNKIKIVPKTILIAGIIMAVLGLSLPGTWLFVFLILVMCLSWQIAAVYQTPLATKMVFEIFAKDRYSPIISFFNMDGVGILTEGLNVTTIPVWFPFVRLYVFDKQILEIDKYKVEDKLPTSSQPCKFELVGNDFVEIPQDPNKVTATTGPAVEFFVNQRLRMFEDPSIFLRLNDEDRRDYKGLVRRVTQNMFRRTNRKLSLSQSLSGGYFVSNHHRFYLDLEDEEGRPLEGHHTFMEALNMELMRAIGFRLVSIETSDANPPEGLEKAQEDLERAKIKLEEAKVVAQQTVVEIKAEGKAYGAKLKEIQKQLADAKEAAELMAILEFAKSDSNIILPTAILDKLGTLAQAATNLAKLS